MAGGTPEGQRTRELHQAFEVGGHAGEAEGPGGVRGDVRHGREPQGAGEVPAEAAAHHVLRSAGGRRRG